MTKGEIIKIAKDRIQNKEFVEYGICYTLAMVITREAQNLILPSFIPELFSELKDKELVKKYGGNFSFDNYWPQGWWNTGRLDFFNMLYEKYKDDNTEI